ncbi:MAG: fused MFS/spermidine synthase, partial [Hyphomicrobiales bacterium]|nr:fused MFS/spermidine synthase [Hyphomicrobiales bacterium]
RLTVAEIDPMVTALARSQMWFTPGPNTRIKAQDARVALANEPAGERFDIIFGDAFHDIAVPAHLLSAEFHQIVRARLTRPGFYVVNVVDNPRQPRLLASLVRTLRQHFETIEVWVAPDHVRGASRATFIVYAAASATGLPDTVKASHGYPNSWRRVRIDSLNVAQLGLTLTDDFTPIDRLLSTFWFFGD